MGHPKLITPTWSPYGAIELKPTGSGTLRTAYQGKFGAFGYYSRFASNEFFSPPYSWRGRVNVRGRKYPYIFDFNGKEATYHPGLVFHVLHDIEGTEPTGNKENVSIRFASKGQENASPFAEMPTGYGWRTGIDKKIVGPSPYPDGTGWHTFEAKVKSHGEWEFFWDGERICYLKEKNPTTMHGRVGVGLRFDFLDVELDDVVVEKL